MVEFFKKIDKNTHSDVFDSSVSSFYSDLSEKGTTLTVRSGVYNDLALFDFPVPHPPSYGDGKLIGFDFRFVMSDSDVTNKVNYQGEHHMYLFKENKNMGDEEGTVNRVVDSTNQVFAPAMTIFAYADDFSDDPFSLYVEDFTFTEDDIVVDDVAGTVVHREFHYLTIDDALSAYGQIPNLGLAWGNPQRSELEEEFSSIHPLTGEKIIEVKAKDDGWESVKSKPFFGKLFWYNNASAWNARTGEAGVKNLVKSLSKTRAETVADEQNSFKEATTDSTFFDNIQVPPNYLKPDAATKDANQTSFNIRDTVFHAYAGANFSTEKYRTGGSSLNLRAFIDFDGIAMTTSPTSQREFDFGTGFNRQSICVMKQNLPSPTRFFDDVNAKSYTLASQAPSMLKEIDIDIYFDELGCAYVMGSGVHAQDAGSTYTHLRSFAILFGHNDVDDNQDFADYVASHLTTTGGGTIGDVDVTLTNTTDVERNLMGVMFYRVPRALGAEGTGGTIQIKTLRGDGASKFGTDDEVIFDTVTTGTNFDNEKVLGWTTHSTPTGYQLTTGKWYRLKFVYDINGGDGIQNNNDASSDNASNMKLWIFDGDTGELATAALGGDASGNAYIAPINVTNCNVDPADRTNSSSRWPKNMSIWLNNIAHQHDTDTATNEDNMNTLANNNPLYARSSVFIDKISIRNQNLRHANASGENNPHFSSAKGVISSPNKTLRLPANFGGASSAFDVPPTGLALGFNDRSQLNGATGYLLFNGFSSGGTSKPDAIADADLHAGAATNALPVKMGDVADIMEGGSDLLDSLTIGASGTNVLTGDGVNADPLQDVDGFSQKGVVKVTNITWDNANDRRECSWASAKILKKKSVTTSIAEVVIDDPVVLSAPAGTQFIIYKMNANFAVYDSGNATTTSNYAIVELSKLDGNVATFNFVSSTPLSLLIQDGTGFSGSDYRSSIQDLWVSPYLYWLFIQTADDGAHGQRTYQSVCMIDDDLATTSGGKGLGVTFNEESFSTNSGNTEYFLRRKLGLSGEDTIFDTDDFGFGTFKENQTGYVSRFVPKLGINDINLDNVLHKRKPKAGDRLSFAMRPTESAKDTRVVICSGSHGTTANRPKLFARFEDELPTIEDFTVSPNKDNPQFLDFNWKTEAKDLWYGLLHIDNKQINSQYENAIAHMPLDEDSVAASTIFLYYPDQGDRYTDRAAAGSRVAATVTDTDGTASTVTAEKDGLAGFCKQFDAADSELDFSTGSSLTDPGNEMTLVAHCIPNLVTSTATRNLFFRNEFLTVTLQSASAGTFVQAVIQNSNDDTYTLKSPYVYTDGETPLSIIVTFDKDITANNAKLFVNGALSDSLSVDLDYGLKVNNSDIIIGNDDNNDDDGFNGKIEEVVLYNKCLEVINPQSKKFTYTKPLKNGETNKATSAGSGSPETYYARLFLKDYHNIRGYTTDEVASSSQLTVRKTSFRLADT